VSILAESNHDESGKSEAMKYKSRLTCLAPQIDNNLFTLRNHFQQSDSQSLHVRIQTLSQMHRQISN
jgi:hypothetical protein